MKKLIITLAVLGMALGAFAAHDNVLLYSDAYWGTNYSRTALNNLGWTYTWYGNGASGASSYVTDIGGSTAWDIAGFNNYMYNASSSSAGTATSTYVTGGGSAFFSSYNSGLMGQCSAAFGASTAGSISGSTIPSTPPYVWDASHDIFTQVTTPSWTNPGVITAGYRLTAGTADAILGFVASETAGQAGITDLNGVAVFLGYEPEYMRTASPNGIELFEDIWSYLDAGGSSLGAFALLTPTDGEIFTITKNGLGKISAKALKSSPNATYQVDFTWEESTGFATYSILVDDDSDFSSPIVDESGLTDETFSYTFSLGVDTEYFWRVTSHDGASGSRNCNADFSFEITADFTEIQPTSMGNIKANYK